MNLKLIWNFWKSCVCVSNEIDTSRALELVLCDFVPIVYSRFHPRRRDDEFQWYYVEVETQMKQEAINLQTKKTIHLHLHWIYSQISRVILIPLNKRSLFLASVAFATACVDWPYGFKYQIRRAIAEDIFRNQFGSAKNTIENKVEQSWHAWFFISLGETILPMSEHFHTVESTKMPTSLQHWNIMSACEVKLTLLRTVMRHRCERSKTRKAA